MDRNNIKSRVSVRGEITERSRQKRFLKFKKNSIYGGILVIFLIGLFSFLSHLDYFEIKEINIVGTEIVEDEEIEVKIKEVIDDSYIFLFSKKNVLIYPRVKIKDTLLSSFKRIENIEVELNDNTLNVSILERRGKYLWCGDKENIKDAFDTPCLFLDDNGLIFDEAPFFSGPVYFTFYTENNSRNVDANIGAPLFEDRVFFTILEIIKILKDRGVYSSGVFIKSDNVFEFLIGQSVDQEQSRLIIKNDEFLKETLDNFFSALSASPLKESYENDFKDMLYIDLRFDDRVVYKFK